MQFKKTIALANGNNSLKTLLVANGYTLPTMWADEFFIQAPGANYTAPNTADISLGKSDVAALDDGERFRPGESDNLSPGTGKVDLTQFGIFAPDANQRVVIRINTQ
jgi:hypothetical protein